MPLPMLRSPRPVATLTDEVKPPASAELLDREPKNEGEEPNQGPRNVLPIPLEMWKRARERLGEFIDQELNLCESERWPMMARMARWKEAYIAPLPDGPKNFPIPNSSNLTVPLIKEHVHTLVGQLVQSTIAQRPYVTFKDLAWEWTDYVDLLERFLDTAADRDLDYEESCILWIIESAILGTSIMEVPYEVDERSVYRYTVDGKRTFKTNVIFQDGPTVKHVPIGSFWIRMDERDPQKARWCAKRLQLSEMELLEKEAQGKFYGVRKILDFYAKPEDDEKVADRAFTGARNDLIRQAEDEALKQKPIMPSKLEIFEIYISYDIDGDGRFEELRLYYHRDSRNFVGRQFLPYWSGQRGFIKLGYFPRIDRFYDEGIAEMLEQIQIAVSAIVNRRADNATMANLKMILKRKILRSLMPGDPLYTGKIIEVNDIYNDVREFSMSEIYPSTVSEEQILRGLADRLSGINEGAQGAAMPVTRTTAAAQLALLQEQRNRIGLSITKIRKGQRKIFQLAFWHYNQFGTNSKGLLWMGEKGRIVDAIFRLPRRVKELIQAIDISVPTSLQNKQVKRENAIAVFNLMVQLYKEMLPLVQALAPNALGEVVGGMVKSARHFMQEVLETFDVSDPDAVLTGIASLERILPAPENLGGMAAHDGRAETAQILDGLSRVEGILREAEAARDGNGRVSPGGERPRRTAPPERNGRGAPESILFGGESLFQRR